MRILQVSPFSFWGVGGVSEHVRNISKELAQRHDVTVYATETERDFPRVEHCSKVKVEEFRHYAPRRSYYFSWEMLFKLRKTSFDVVHAHGYHALPMHFSALAKCRRFVVTTHFHGAGSSVFRNSLVGLLKPLGGLAIQRANRIVAVSDYEKSLICQQFKSASDKIVVIPNGVDLSEFSGLERQSHDFRSILYVGYLMAYKGVRYLVEVLPQLHDDVVLEIVGRGPLARQFLERRARELRVQDRVRFYEYLPRRELLQKYADADVFVLLSKYEAYSLVVAEALAAGTPCVVAENSALKEWVDNHSCFGVSVPIKLGELARVINGVLDGHVDKRVMKKWIGTKILDWSDVAKRLESIYEE